MFFIFRDVKEIFNSKKLSEMTLEELWHLFPISLVPHNDAWCDWYCEEANFISEILLGTFKLYHIGSTAVPGIYAKNIVDILAVSSSDENASNAMGEAFASASALVAASEALCENGWICMSRSDSRISLNKGYTEAGFADRVFHLHLRLQGDDDEIYFRDYLCLHPETAKEYETLKLSLWKKFEFDRDDYTEAKTEFVRKISTLAKELAIVP